MIKVLIEIKKSVTIKFTNCAFRFSFCTLLGAFCEPFLQRVLNKNLNDTGSLENI